MINFKYLPHDCPVSYPVGRNYYETFEYIKGVANIIQRTFPDGMIILIARGHSGSIIAGGLAFTLRKEHKRDVLISISRKDPSHGYTLEGIRLGSTIKEYFIVVDDFVQTGDTILSIIKDLKENAPSIEIYDMLCVGNHWDENDFSDDGIYIDDKYIVNNDWKTNLEISKHFRYICCNKYYYKK